jgi:lipid-A-disaccharide synthase
LKIFISAGEASGDALGASLIQALRSRAPELEPFGMGGPAMRALGFDAVRDASEVSVVGLVEVLRHLFRLFRLKNDLARIALERRPSVAVLIDVPDFNLRLAKALRRSGIPIVFYVGPSVWAWRPGRVHAFRRVLDRLLVLFPFEIPPWAAAGVDVVCVGHPLIDQVEASPDVASKVIALLPGSRRSEIDRLLPIMLGAAERLATDGVAERFVVPVAPTLDAASLAARVAAHPIGARVEVVEGDADRRRSAVASARIALVASGTATLETALIGRPQVIVYLFNRLTFFIGRRMTKLSWIGLPNIILGRAAVPELLQEHVTVENVVARAKELMADGPARDRASEAARMIRAKLGDRGAADRAAAAVLELLERQGT